MYKKIAEVITFQMKSQQNKILNKKQFTENFQLSSYGPFEVHKNEQVLQIFIEMGYQPPISLVNGFKKSSIPGVRVFSLELPFDVWLEGVLITTRQNFNSIPLWLVFTMGRRLNMLHYSGLSLLHLLSTERKWLRFLVIVFGVSFYAKLIVR